MYVFASNIRRSQANFKPQYIAAIVLTPLTAFPSRLSAIYQAFLLGMFLQGVAKFGFDSILQTAAEVQTFFCSVGSALTLFRS